MMKNEFTLCRLLVQVESLTIEKESTRKECIEKETMIQGEGAVFTCMHGILAVN